jgi:hypothetical protein
MIEAEALLPSMLGPLLGGGQRWVAGALVFQRRDA